MSSKKVVCPHCGHDGTPETSKPPLLSFGFNYLADGTVCREVCGYDDSGKLTLSAEFKCEGVQAANARLECRSCWQTFSLPEDLPVTLMAAHQASAEETAFLPAESTDQAAADQIAKGLVTVVRKAMQDLEQSFTGEIARLDAAVANAGRTTAEQAATLKEDIGRLRLEVSSLLDARQQLQSKVASCEAGIAAQQETLPQIWERLRVLTGMQEEFLRRADEHGGALAGLQEQTGQLKDAAAAQDALRERVEGLGNSLEAAKESMSRMEALHSQLQDKLQGMKQRQDAQADVIRALHSTAQEQLSRREQLQAAVQRLEEIAGELEQVQPLPPNL